MVIENSNMVQQNVHLTDHAIYFQRKHVKQISHDREKRLVLYDSVYICYQVIHVHYRESHIIKYFVNTGSWVNTSYVNLIKRITLLLKHH